MDNPCLRPASLSDVLNPKRDLSGGIPHPWYELLRDQYMRQQYAIRKLYDAEWRKRGFKRCP